MHNVLTLPMNCAIMFDEVITLKGCRDFLQSAKIFELMGVGDGRVVYRG